MWEDKKKSRSQTLALWYRHYGYIYLFFGHHVGKGISDFPCALAPVRSHAGGRSPDGPSQTFSTIQRQLTSLSATFLHFSLFARVCFAYVLKKPGLYLAPDLTDAHEHPSIYFLRSHADSMSQILCEEPYRPNELRKWRGYPRKRWLIRARWNFPQKWITPVVETARLYLVIDHRINNRLSLNPKVITRHSNLLIYPASKASRRWYRFAERRTFAR